MSFSQIHDVNARPQAADTVLACWDGSLLVRQNAGAVELPLWSGVEPCVASSLEGDPLHVGQLEGRACWLLSLAGEQAPEVQGFEWLPARSLMGMFDEAKANAAACALSLYWWRKRSRYCGACGSQTEVLDSERVARCPSCGQMYYPTASAAVIVAITRGETILLAHNKGFRAGVFSTLAGFVDAGESLEQTLVREVREEVGIEVEDIEYVASQSWPFPNSLMVGFRAKYKSGEICVDGKEIETADWFSRYHLPVLPVKGSMARVLVDNWLQRRL